VDHGLVGPLVEQWGDGIIPPVQNQEKGGRVRLLELKQLVLLLHYILHRRQKKEREGKDEGRKRGFSLLLKTLRRSLCVQMSVNVCVNV